MNDASLPLADRLPYASPPLPEKWRWLRLAGYILVAVLLILAVIQFQRGTAKVMKELDKAAADPTYTPRKEHKGAIGRWRSHVGAYWAGENIYVPPPAGVAREASSDDADDGPTLHPNMPFVVLLLTPFTLLPVPLMALAWNVAKVLVVSAMFLAAVSVANDGRRRMAEWVALIGLLLAIDFIIGDLQHGNTNILVAGTVIGHLWFFRRGNDWMAGLMLALGICLKMTPALFVLYWIYQRQWKLLGATVGFLVLMMLSPALLVGWSFHVETTRTWWNELIYPGLVGQTWYPVHVNQSLPAMIGRYFTSGDSGNILWDPDHDPVPVESDWITVVDLGARNAKLLLQALQAIMVLATAWAIGLRKLGRDDGRRMVHYGLVVTLMLLLNQRTWDHHAPYILVADLALVYAIAYGNLSPRFRKTAGWLLAGSFGLLLLMSGDLLELIAGSEEGANRLIAYGTAFWHFLVLWILCLVTAWKLRNREPAYRDVAGTRPQMSQIAAG